MTLSPEDRSILLDAVAFAVDEAGRRAEKATRGSEERDDWLFKEAQWSRIGAIVATT